MMIKGFCANEFNIVSETVVSCEITDIMFS